MSRFDVWKDKYIVHMRAMQSLSHELSHIVRRILGLSKSQDPRATIQYDDPRMRRRTCVPLETLYILPTDFVIQNVGNLVCRNFLASRTFMDTVLVSTSVTWRNLHSSTHPTMVTPIGQGALPMDKRR